MNKYIFQFICLIVLASSYVVVFSTGKSLAGTHSFAGVSQFTTPSGRIGFFEQGTGKIFIYDAAMSTCVFIGQLNVLGEPIEKIK